MCPSSDVLRLAKALSLFTFHAGALHMLGVRQAPHQTRAVMLEEL